MPMLANDWSTKYKLEHIFIQDVVVSTKYKNHSKIKQIVAVFQFISVFCL